MPSDPAALDLDALKQQQAVLRRRGRLSRLHIAIVSISVIVTFIAWYTSSNLLEQRAQQRFDREVGRVIGLVQERMRHYEDALLSGVASIQAMGVRITRDSWKRYADNLLLGERYPGISGIGVIFHLTREELGPFSRRAAREHDGYTVHPDHEFDFSLPIAYIEPEASNAAALGLDVAFEHNRRVAALRARRLGITQISGPIVLVQDALKTPGFLFYAPYYESEDHLPPAGGVSSHFREQRFRGLVYAPLIVDNLIAGTLDQRSRDVQFSIRDGEQVLFQDSDLTSDDASGDGMHPAYTSTHDIEMYGRVWSFEFRGHGTSSSVKDAYQPLLVLLSGLVIDAMLFMLFWLMSRANRGVLVLAEQMTDDLARQAQALSGSNEELRNYAHIVSHDLQTPIRGIRDLAEFIKEDLGDYLASNDADPQVGENLDRLNQQAVRGQTLITGILDYSRVGVLDQALSVVDVHDVIAGIRITLNLRPDQIVTDGDMPAFQTHAVRLGQVFDNLIGNAVKYHPDRERAQVRVAVARHAPFYRFTVTDNGPGIDPQFHEKIFEVFERLDSSADVPSSGIGLSIVKKSVELLGGTISVESAAGQGATFRFDWPMELEQRAA